jgi:hypothetical protein
MPLFLGESVSWENWIEILMFLGSGRFPLFTEYPLYYSGFSKFSGERVQEEIEFYIFIN